MSMFYITLTKQTSIERPRDVDSYFIIYDHLDAVCYDQLGRKLIL